MNPRATHEGKARLRGLSRPGMTPIHRQPYYQSEWCILQVSAYPWRTHISFVIPSGARDLKNNHWCCAGTLESSLRCCENRGFGDFPQRIFPIFIGYGGPKGHDPLGMTRVEWVAVAAPTPHP